MRKVTQQATENFMANKECKVDNTKVIVKDGITHLYLFDKLIAFKTEYCMNITDAGWKTNTTKDRLNALPNVSIRQVTKNGVKQWFLNGVLWDGKWAVIRLADED